MAKQAQVETQATVAAAAATRKQAIPNVAALSDDALRAALKKHGVSAQKVGAAKTRANLIRLARDAKLWDYRGDVVPAKYKAKYGATQNCGDTVAAHLTGESVDFLHDVAEANGIDFARWSHCNRGQLTMNLGNVLRGKIKRGEYVIVGTTEWNPENA